MQQIVSFLMIHGEVSIKEITRYNGAAAVQITANWEIHVDAIEGNDLNDGCTDCQPNLKSTPEFHC